MTKKKIFVQQSEGVTAVNFSHSSLFNPQQVEEVIGDLMQMVLEEGCKKLLLDFTRVRSFSSAFLGSLLDLKRLCDEKGSRMALTGLSKTLMDLIHKVQLDEALSVFAEREAAVVYLKSETSGDEVKE
jgi:anti-anti-sigma factor